jgi:type IV pilus assembly protein PilY1
VRVGLGHFSAYNSGTTTGDGSSGEILVPAKALGTVGSTQRVALKTAVAGLVASNGTPSAHAFAEAAAYLMGTSTYTENRVYRDIAVEKQRLIRRYSRVAVTVSGKTYYRYTYTYQFSTCQSLNATTFGNTNTQSCANWEHPPIPHIKIQVIQHEQQVVRILNGLINRGVRIMIQQAQALFQIQIVIQIKRLF